MQKGLFEEEVNRNYKAAITEYRAALAQFDRQRNYGATALFRLAECLRKTARHCAARNGYRGVTEVLLAVKANIHAINNQGETPLHLAAGGSQLAIITLLCEVGAPVNEADAAKLPLPLA